MALEPFIWGAGGARLTPEQIAREREIAQSLMGVDTSPVGHWLQGAARMANAGVGALRNYRAGQAEQRNAAENQSALSRVLGAFGGGSSGGFGGSAGTSTAMATSPAPDLASARVAQAHGDSGGAFLPQSFLGALDRTEGAGNYDTLFGHAQRSGPFAGTSVSQMPISEVLAFASPSGAYGQHVKGQVGRVATPMGRHQIVGTTLRNAVRELGIDPSTPFNAQTQDQIAAHLAKRRIAGASTMDGKIAGLRSEWEGFRSVPRADMEQIVRDLESMPANAVAANEAMASGGLSSGLTPEALQQWGAANYTDPAAIQAGIPDPVAVAETEEDILEQEAAMVAQDPMAFQQPGTVPPMPEGRVVSDIPVADIAASLTGANVNPDLPMMGGSAGGGFLPAQQQQAAAQQTGGFSPELIQLVSSPYVDSNTRQIAMSLLGQQMQQADPMRQLQMQKAQLELQQMQNPAAPKPIEVGGVLLDPATFQPIFDSRQNDGPASVQEYQFYANQMAGLGQQPLPYDQWDIARRQSAATQVSVGGEGQRMGTIPAGMAAVPDPTNPSGFRLEAIPGGPAAIDEAAAAGQRDAQTVSDAQKAETTLDATRSVLDILDKADTPATGTLSRPFAAFSGTPAGRVRSYVGTLQSGVALGAMQRLKEASATGATGFGALSAPELNLLINDIGALDPDNTEPDIFRKTIERIQDRSRRVAEDIAKNVSPERIQELGLQPFIDAFKASEAKGNRTRSGVQWSIE